MNNSKAGLKAGETFCTFRQHGISIIKHQFCLQKGCRESKWTKLMLLMILYFTNTIVIFSTTHLKQPAQLGWESVEMISAPWREEDTSYLCLSLLSSSDRLMKLLRIPAIFIEFSLLLDKRLVPGAEWPQVSRYLVRQLSWASSLPLRNLTTTFFF